jgi:hypothetical protein
MKSHKASTPSDRGIRKSLETQDLSANRLRRSLRFGSSTRGEWAHHAGHALEQLIGGQSGEVLKHG